MQAKVIVLAGPSGSGKSRLCDRLGLPFVNLDDFYKDGSDPTLPRRPLGAGQEIVDWDDPASWLRDEAVEALERLCTDGRADIPVYDIGHDGRVGHQALDLGGSPYFVAEGVFAQEVVRACRERGLLASAVCVRNHRVVTFWRRLTRDLRERRKPPFVLVRRGLLLMLAEPRVVAHAEALGCRALTPDEAFDHVRSLLAPA
ncbi:MAG: ATP-binding protein [Nocardioides sp.]